MTDLHQRTGWIIFGTIIISIAAIWPIMHSIYENREEMHREKCDNELARVQKELTDLKNKYEHQNVEQHPAKLSSPSPAPDTTPKTSDPGSYGDVFVKGSLYPTGFDQIKMGVTLTKLKALYPEPVGSLGSVGIFTIKPPSGPFSVISCQFGDGYDPPVDYISYAFRDTQTADYLKPRILAAFSGYRSHEERLGAIRIWANVKGCELELSNTSLIISKY